MFQRIFASVKQKKCGHFRNLRYDQSYLMVISWMNDSRAPFENEVGWDKPKDGINFCQVKI